MNKLKLLCFFLGWTFLSVEATAQITGPSAVCAFTATSYSCSTAGTYSWTASPATANFSATTIQNPLVSFTAVGQYTLTVTTTSPANTYTMVVTNSAPLSISTSSNQTVCNGMVTGIYAGASGGTSPYTYTWSGAGSGLVGGGNHNLLFTNTGTTAIIETFSVSVTDANNCPAMAANFDVTVLPKISIQAPNESGCVGDVVQLNATASGGDGAPYTFTWGTMPVTTQSGGSSQVNVLVMSAMPVSYMLTVDDGCSTPESAMITLSGAALTDITGHVTYSGMPVTDGLVALFAPSASGPVYDSIQLVTLDANGYYSFPAVAPGNYLVKCLPNATTYPEVIGAYYGNVPLWDSATVIQHNCSSGFTADIELQSSVAVAGPGFISGWVITADGDPVAYVDVNLVNVPGGGVEMQTNTDSTGYYEFTNISAGDYTITVDITGLPMDSDQYFITITPFMSVQGVHLNAVQNTVFTNISFGVDTISIYPTNLNVGVKEQELIKEEYLIYPNPAKNLLTIRSKNATGITNMEILNPQGKKMYAEKQNAQSLAGSGFSIDLKAAGITTGIYLLKIQSENGMQILKLVVE